MPVISNACTDMKAYRDEHEDLTHLLLRGGVNDIAAMWGHDGHFSLVQHTCAPTARHLLSELGSLFRAHPKVEVRLCRLEVLISQFVFSRL
jgi:hypothetical protein